MRFAYVQENSTERALEEFTRGELYICAYDFNGTTLAHPVNPEKVGVNRLNETGGGGVPCGDERGHTEWGEVPPDRVHQSPAQPDT